MKNNKLIYKTFCILHLAFCISLLSCGEDKESTEVRVTGVTLDRDAVVLAPDSTVQLTATVKPENADNQKVTWHSTEKNLATVDEETGFVTAIAEGVTSIVVTTVDGEFTDTCTVKILHINVPVTGVTLDKDAVALAPDSTVQLTATVMPENADVQEITWHSIGETIATVSTTGLVTAIAEGTTSIVVTTLDGRFTDICTVTVEHVVVPVTGVSLDSDSLWLKPDSTVQLIATVTPENADFKEVTWRSTEETVATVSLTGLVTAIAEGETSIIVTTNEGEFADTCVVTVFVENKYELIADLNPSDTPELLDPTPATGEYWTHKSSFKLWEHKEGYGHGVKITIVGESFNRADNKNDGAYEKWCKKMALRLLKNPIICNFRNYIDIYVAVAESRESRINTTIPGFFGTTITAETNFGKADAFIVEAIPELAGVLNRSFILIANGMMGGWANFGQPAGNGGNAWWSTDMAAESNNDIGTYWMMHEFIGHGFASLADEYAGAGGTYGFSWQESGMVCNVSNTNSLAKVPWSRFIRLSGYNEVGTYQVEPGIWKPEEHSIMESDEWGFYYNAQSRWLIYKHIYDCSKFLDNQSANSPTGKPKVYAPGEEAALFEAFLEFDKLYNTK
jgi:uncharacterized protein YjdB